VQLKALEGNLRSGATVTVRLEDWGRLRGHFVDEHLAREEAIRVTSQPTTLPMPCAALLFRPCRVSAPYPFPGIEICDPAAEASEECVASSAPAELLSPRLSSVAQMKSGSGNLRILFAPGFRCPVGRIYGNRAVSVK
jgi:hypothetical protein